VRTTAGRACTGVGRVRTSARGCERLRGGANRGGEGTHAYMGRTQTPPWGGRARRTREGVHTCEGGGRVRLLGGAHACG
jgi:hypothetical protein